MFVTSSITVKRFEPAVVSTVDWSRRDGPTIIVSSTTPVTEIVPGPSSAIETSTKCAGRLATRPCNVPSDPGGPFRFSPQRHSHSLKPISQPAPSRSTRLTNAGFTGSATGERHPISRPPQGPRHKPIPRVGKIETASLPLFSSTTSTPSDTPPRNVNLLTDQPS